MAQTKKEVIKEVKDTRISEQQAEKLRNMPVVETKVRLSEDKKWLIHETIIRSIKPRKYYEAVCDIKEGGDEQ